MKKLVIISFDLIKHGEPKISLSIGSLLAYLKNSPLYNNVFTVDHFTLNLYDKPNVEDIVQKITDEHNIAEIDFIAISSYVWSEFIINKLVHALRKKGFKNNIILGGYQISYRDNIQQAYPECNTFIMGYGEEALLNVITQVNQASPAFIELSPNFNKLPSPYITQTIPVEQNQKKVRLETKRGCAYKCGYCAHRDLHNNEIHYLPEKRIFDELAFFRDKQVEKINIVDPLFNVGTNYHVIMEKCVEIGLQSLLSLQSRFELIKGKNGDKFMDLSAALNVYLEFGLQSIHKKELKVLDRSNDMSAIKKVLTLLVRKNIPFEVSIIYGIPTQTIMSFNESIQFLRDNGCSNIKAFPLELLRGTPLWYERQKWHCKEKKYGQFDIPYVVNSDSFTLEDWHEMRKIADSLKNISIGDPNVKN